jgi:exopolysaccharide biosynthesis protein
MSFEELGKCMMALGAYNSVNLDGGGSTTFFIRNTSEFADGRFEVRNWPSDNGGKERAVANGLLIVSNN